MKNKDEKKKKKWKEKHEEKKRKTKARPTMWDNGYILRRSHRHNAPCFGDAAHPGDVGL
jgi:hypothetical protein